MSTLTDSAIEDSWIQSSATIADVPIKPGQTLLHYRIVEKIGEGGMGVVWKAVDTTLDREVALKVLLPEVASDPDRLARFDREAKLLASINHRNIAAVYGFQEHDGVRFAAMELVGGEDLSERIERGNLPVAEALEIAAQIAEALAAAHDRGVIHRDLKPANVRVTPDGTVKVLDFGLAKSLEGDPTRTGSDPSASPTMTSGGTAFGMILGTPAYMSPEQARGKPVDRRADLWAFGCLLFEMLTGQRAFGGETVTDTLSAVISGEPDWNLLPESAPAATRRLLRRCLEKSPSARVRDAADARLELLELDELAPMTGMTAATSAKGNSWLRLAAAGLLGAAIVGAAWLTAALGSRPASTGPTDQLPPVHQVTFTGDVADSAAIGGASDESAVGMDLAADGRTAVYLTQDRDQVILIDLDGGGSQTLYTAGPGINLLDVAWSPEGDRVYLSTWPYSERVLSLPRFGGEPRQEFELGKLSGLNGVFVKPLTDERWLVFGSHNTLYIGKDPGALTAQGTKLEGPGVFKIEGLDLLSRVAISRDGRRIAFQGVDVAGNRQCGVLDDAGKSTLVSAWSDLAPVSWTEGDRFLYLWRSTGTDIGDLLRVEMDSVDGRPMADLELVYPRLQSRSVQVSADGTRLVLRAGDRVANLREFTLDGTRDASDNPTRMRTQGTGRWHTHDFMPDGTLLASLAGDLGWELFAISTDGTRRSLLRRSQEPTAVTASHDGKFLGIPIQEPADAILLYDIANNRSRTLPVPAPVSMLDWSRDGKHIVAMTTNLADSMVTVDVATGEARTVTLACGHRCAFAYEGIHSGPEWPYAAVTSEVDTWIVNAVTGELRHVASNSWNILGWLDSFLYFSRGGGQTDWPGNVLFRVPADGGVEDRLLDLPAECGRFRIAPDGKSLVCDIDESRLDLRLVRDL